MCRRNANGPSCNKLYFAHCSQWISASLLVVCNRRTREQERQGTLRARYFEFAIIMALLVKLSISQVIYVDCSSRCASTSLYLSFPLSVYIFCLLCTLSFLRCNCPHCEYSRIHGASLIHLPGYAHILGHTGRSMIEASLKRFFRETDLLERLFFQRVELAFVHH